MTRFARRLLGAAVLDRRTYEELEADRQATPQAVGVVLLASIAGGVGLPGVGVSNLQALIAGVSGALVGWVAWAALTYLIGTRLLPEPQPRADLGELLRTIAFASAPGFLRVLGVIPIVGLTILCSCLSLDAARDDRGSAPGARLQEHCARGGRLRAGMGALADGCRDHWKPVRAEAGRPARINIANRHRGQHHMLERMGGKTALL